MKISEHARKAATDCCTASPVDFKAIIQRAMDDHERDLVEAAEKVFDQYYKPMGQQSVRNLHALKAALDRRCE